MARTAKQKAQQKALRNARSDGKVTGKEAKALRSQGVSEKQIQNTRNDTVRVGKGAQPKAPKAPAAPKQPASPSQKIANFSEDGEISKTEARQLVNSGVTLQDLKFNSSATLGQGSQNIFRRPVLESQAATKAANSQAREDTLLGMSLKEMRALQGQAAMGIPIYNGDPNEPDITDPFAGRPNYYNFGGEPYQNQNRGWFERGGVERNLSNNGNNLSNVGNWKKVQEHLGIRTVDKPEDLARMFNYVNGVGNNVGVNKGNGGSSESELADRSSGDFNDIKAALGEDQAAGFDAAAELDAKEVPVGNDYLDIINGLLTQQGTNEANFNSTLATQQSDFEATLAAQAAESAASLGQLNDLFTTQYAGLESLIGTQQENFNSAQAFTNQQLASANAALLAEQQRSANLGNAYVPQANPTAMSIGYGDGRTTRRKKDDNQLSDLTLMNGLGTQSNPLAGLQLA